MDYRVVNVYLIRLLLHIDYDAMILLRWKRGEKNKSCKGNEDNINIKIKNANEL